MSIMYTELIQPPAKNHRIATRVTKAHKALFERAALLKGLTLTDFMVSAAYEAALKVLQESQILLTLGPEDSRFVFEHLLSPRQPEELPELQKAIQQAQQNDLQRESLPDWEATLALYRATPPNSKTLQKPTRTIGEVYGSADLSSFEEPALTAQEWEAEWWKVRAEMRLRDQNDQIRESSSSHGNLPT